MKMTHVSRLNYNYYYFSFDVQHQSNYKIVKRDGERRGETEKERSRGGKDGQRFFISL